MSVKILEGENLELLIEKAKATYGNNIEILYYEVETKQGILPFTKKKFYRLFFKEKENKKEETQSLKEELDSLKELIFELKKEVEKPKDNTVYIPPPQDIPEHIKQPTIPYQNSVEHGEFTGDALELIRILENKNVFPDVAREIVEPACGLDLETNKLDLNTPTFREAVEKGISQKVKFTGRLKIEKTPKIIAFVGPTGVGKTTNLFKIASDLVINQQLKVGVISIDTFKVGAIQQARMYANILNIPFYTVSEAKKLKEVINNLKEIDVILIDTVGRSHYDYWRLGEIKAILNQGSEHKMDIQLVISCNYSNEEALEVVNRYRTVFPISAILFTKVDETKKPGILLNIPVKTDIPVSYLSTGQRVPEDIKLLSPKVLTDYILGDV